MRKRYFAVLLVLAVLLGLLGGCKQAEEPPEEQDAPLENAAEPRTETPEAAETDPNALTAEEIEQVNEAFAATYTEDGVSYATQVSCFFTSYYEKPEDINFREFMYLFSPGEILPDDSEELQALSRLEGWPYTGYFEPDALPCPTHKYKRSDVDAALERYMGITTADLTYVNDSGPTLLYLEEYDAYYNFTSDFGPGSFQCEAGVRDGGTVHLTGAGRELTLEQQPDGTYHIVSFLPAEGTESGT